MALGQIDNKRRKYYLTISEGKVVHNEKGQKEYYSYIEGTLERIYRQERTFNGETVPYWYIDIRGEAGELYSLSLPFKSGTFKSIVLCLASEDAIGLSKIKIEPYMRGDFTKVVVNSNGRKLDWIVNVLPPVETIQIAGQDVKDDTKRMAYISSLVEQINRRIN